MKEPVPKFKYFVHKISGIKIDHQEEGNEADTNLPGWRGLEE
jgi:hypothetical protein